MTGSLRSRLLLLTVAGMTLVLAVFALAMNAAVDQSLTGGFDAALAATARTLAAEVDQEDGKIMATFDDAEMDLSVFKRAERAEYFQLWSEDGTVVARSPSLGSADLPRGAASPEAPGFDPVVLLDCRRGRAVTFVFLPKVEEKDGRSPGRPTSGCATLVVARGTADIDAKRSAFRWLLGGAAAGTILLTLLVSALVVRQGLRPLDKLAAQIAAIREESLDTTIPPDGMPREMTPIVNRLNDLLHRLQDAFQRERAFTADAAHELRTPLAGIRATLEVALSRARTPEEYQGALRESVEIVGHMQAVVTDLLLLARLEGGQVPLRPEPVPLGQEVERLWRPLAGLAEKRAVRFASQVPADLVAAADRELLAMAISNLLANAAEYTNDGGRIEISGRAAEGKVELAFSNTACCLSPEQAEHVFERFWRGDAARAAGVHCGLGLALVDRAVAVLGGKASAAVSPDGVFTVRLVLPAAASSQVSE
ncbi:MAG: ATP-binding protein [Planctomycetota bacterium]|nr:ATP-binding protein [Planctomycetota bacterium]